MSDYIIPLIIRGQIIEDDLVDYSARRSELSFRSPDVKKYLDRLVLKDPIDLQDLYRISLDEIVDYLVELGPRLDYRKNPHIALALEMQILTSHHTREMLENSYVSMLQALTRPVIEERLEKNIGRKYLEGWVDEKMMDRTVAVRAFGARAIHAIAGNSGVIALETILDNAVTRSDAIIKIPSNDPYFSTAVARTMVEMAPNHPVTRHLSVAYWKGGDASVEKFLYDSKNVEKIVAWGGFDSMRSIREYLAPGLDLVALDPKLSASIIGRAAFDTEASTQDAAERAAADVGYFNQGGCLSARTIYLESGTDEAGVKRANQFGKRVFEAIQALPSRLSSPHPAFDPTLRAEIDGIRYSDAFRVFGGKASEGAVIVSQYDEQVDFSERLDCRVANVVPVDSIDAALHHLTIHSQTIGIYPDSLKSKIRDQCALRGGQRIVSLGMATAGNLSGPHDAIEPLRRMVRWLRDDQLESRAGVLHG